MEFPRKSAAMRLYVALVHHPVVNKNGDVIASAVTNLDLHDISRAARTYGVTAFYVVTPLADQQVLANRILGHWIDGFGGRYNPKRAEALSLARVKSSLDQVVGDIREALGVAPKMVATSAAQRPGAIGFDRCRWMIGQGVPTLLILGTAWGLAREVMAAVDYTLEPIVGGTDYNHLSVRSAASILLDRLVGRPWNGDRGDAVR